MIADLSQLVEDHHRIQHAVQALLDEVERPLPNSAELTRRLSNIGNQVGSHIAVENMLIAECDKKTMPPAWSAVWEDGKATFRDLCDDWGMFLAEWNRENIDADLPGFRAAARAMFGRLSERMEAETRSFYLTGLQTSVIGFG